MFGKKNKNEYVVRYHAYRHIENGDDNKTDYGSYNIEYRGTEEQCKNYIKTLYLDKAIKTVDAVSDTYYVSLDLYEDSFRFTTIDKSKGRDYHSYTYEVLKYAFWMD